MTTKRLDFRSSLNDKTYLELYFSNYEELPIKPSLFSQLERQLEALENYIEFDISQRENINIE